MSRYDAILIPGGGVREQGELPLWVIARLDKAAEFRNSNYFITLSAGTTHKPPPLENGFPIFESIAGAKYLNSIGIDSSKILAETCSYDTIGNAYFALMIHLIPRNLNNLLVVTTAFHMPRTQFIFDWMYNLYEDSKFSIDFIETEDLGIETEDLKERIQKEAKSLENFKVTTSKINSFSDFHQWLFTEHKAYIAAHTFERESESSISSLKTY